METESRVKPTCSKRKRVEVNDTIQITCYDWLL
jgi:hypothetical protein